jgi:uncharacterized protein YprB with RNaseH-like and TPR domain
MSRDLRSRLDAALGTAKPDPEAERQEKIRDLRGRLETLLDRRPGRRDEPPRERPKPEPVALSLDVDALVPGELRATPHGPAFVAVRRYPLFHHQGTIPLDSYLAADAHALGRFAGEPRLGDIPPEGVLFIDTETTGLAGGTGVYAFLVGTAFFAGGELVVEQFFMRDYGEEAAALFAFAERAAPFAALVSFNGKAFDVPLIDTRFTMNRIGLRLQGRPHVDLLFPARRLWRGEFPDCSLGSIEAGVLAHVRVEDVPGHQIPEIYFQYVRRRDARAVARVFRHNELDLVSLVPLAARIARLAAEGPDCRDAGARELYGLGRFHAHFGEHDRAAACLARALARALERSAPAALTESARRELSLALKRLGRHAEAVAVWEAMTDRATDAFPFIELAKHYEHRERDLARALSYAEEAARQRAFLAPDEVADLDHRLARLRRKRET